MATLLGYMFVEARMLTVSRYEVASPDLPTSFDGLTIAFVTDIHHGPLFSRARVRKLVDRVNRLDADVVVLGGDYGLRDPKYIAPAFAELARLRAPLGVYAVLGNHERGSADVARHEIAAAGIVSLDDRGAWITLGGDRLRIGGVGDYEQDLGAAVGDAQDGDLILIVSHHPDYAAKLPAGKVDLVLGEHTHGGQVTFFGLWAPIVAAEYGQRYRSGLVTEGPTPTIVSNGVGTITVPLRFFARPEIVLLTLRDTTR